VPCPLDRLLLPWWLYQAERLPFFALRTYCGALELGERRWGGAAPDTPAHYTVEELRRLLHVPRQAPVTAALHALEQAGLLAWSEEALQFLPDPTSIHDLDLPGYHALRAQLPAWRRWVPIPRRLLRWLAQEGTPGLFATAVGVLLRCLWAKRRQCVSGGRVAATWIATGFGVAERTVQRALAVLQGCGWLARLATRRCTERQHGRLTVVNLGWQAPGTRDEDHEAETTRRHTPEATAAPGQEVPPQEVPGESAATLHHNLSPLAPCERQNLSPLDENNTLSPGNSGASAPHHLDVYPFQEVGTDPVPAPRDPAGVSHTATGTERRPEPTTHPPTVPPSSQTLPADLGAAFAALPPNVQATDYTAARQRLMARGVPPAFLIRPVILAEVFRAALPMPPAETTPPQLSPPPPPTPARAPVHRQASVPCTPPTLRHVVPEDLTDLARLEALRQQAIARGGLRRCEADQLNVVAAAVHARRVGEDPCALFVTLVCNGRWAVITQDDEDRARTLLREHATGPRCQAATAAAPERTLSDDARFALLATQVLQQAGWLGDPCLAVKQQYPDWTRARWDAAQAELAHWR
jgi:hypothetical protein